MDKQSLVNPHSFTLWVTEFGLNLNSAVETQIPPSFGAGFR